MPARIAGKSESIAALDDAEMLNVVASDPS
jgi:hypothetical protein